MPTETGPWDLVVPRARHGARGGAAPCGEQALARCADRWDAKSPASSPRWRAAWERWTGVLDDPPATRRAG